VPLTNDAVVMRCSVLQVKVLVAQMKTVIAAIAEYDRHIEAPQGCNSTASSQNHRES
jgi:hypothetical protein